MYLYSNIRFCYLDYMLYIILGDDNNDSCPTSDDAAALREFQAKLLATQPQMAAPQMGRRGSGGRRHTLCLSR